MFLRRYAMQVCFVCTLVLAACGGGGSSVDDDGGIPPPSPSALNKGGTPAQPAPLSFSKANEIGATVINNYFTFVAAAGETLVIKSTLAVPLTDTWFTRCGFNPTANYTGIDVVGLAHSCSMNLRHTFSAAGTYQVRLGFPDSNSGYFYAALLPAGASPAPLAGASGRPDAPRSLELSGINRLLEDDFFNHYAYDAVAGETLFIQVNPDVTPTAQDSSRCSFGSPYSSYYSYGLLLSGSDNYLCGTFFEVPITTTGRIQLHIRFKNVSKGSFQVVSDR